MLKTFLSKKIAQTAWLAAGFALGVALLQVTSSNVALADGATVGGGNTTGYLTCEDAAVHRHSYQNTSNPPSGKESHARIFKFRIYLHPDFIQNVDLDTVWCSGLNDWLEDCAQPGGAQEAARGGTEVHLVRNSTDPNALYRDYFEWTYGIDTPSDSPTISDLAGNYNGTELEESIIFEFKNNIETGVATTTAATWIKFMEYDVACGRQFGAGTAQCWQDVEEDDVPGTTGYHWNTETLNIQSVYTCAAPEPVCADLTWDSSAIWAGNNLGVDALFANPGPLLTAHAVDTTGADITNQVDYHYTAVDRQGGAALGGYHQGGLDRGTNFVSTANIVNYRNGQPGDRLRVEVVGAENACSQELYFPFCSDLDMEPDGVVTLNGSTEIQYNARASTSQVWPFPVTFTASDRTATFDDENQPYETEKTSGILFESDATSGEVTAEAANDFFGTCTDTFNYVNTPTEITCDDLTITNVDDQGDQICFDWTAENSDGTPSSGPFVLESDNPNGTFVNGPRTTDTSTCYTGEPGDIITVTDTQNPSACVDTLTVPGEEPNDFTCTDLDIGSPEFPDGTTVNVSEPEVVEDLYDGTTVCYDVNIETSDADFKGVAQATGFAPNGNSTGTLTLNIDSKSNSGNPARVEIDDQTQYQGSVCWQNFPEGGRISVNVIGENTCEDEDVLPPVQPQNLTCEDLTLTPEIFILDDDQDELDEETVRAEVRGSANDFEGTARVTGTGACTLEYANGDSAENDGSLLIPVEGSFDTFEFTARDCEEGDDIQAEILGFESVCEDQIPVERDEPELVCHDVSFDADDIDVGDDETVDVEVDSEDDDNTVIITYDCDHGDEIIEYDDEEYDGELVIRHVDGDETIENVTFQNICEEAEIRVEVEDEDCDDELRVRDNDEEQPTGVFKKFLFTFNFAVEKNPYTDESIFFSHDEDRVFYTLEYDPTEEEDTITFTDSMWDDELEGKLGGGASSGGRVHLATNWDELTNAKVNGSSYNYKTILKFGFGDIHERGTDAIASAIDSRYNAENYPVFIPYIQYYQAEPTDAPLIPECTDDSNEVCYDPSYNPTAAGEHKVVIRNTQSLPQGAAIRIRYVGVVESHLNCESSGDSCLTETFENTARIENETGASTEANAKLVVLCSYLVTRNAGDVYLDVQLHGGSDISCVYADDAQGRSTEYRNTDGLVILGQNENRTNGAGQDLSVCDSDPYSDGTIGNLSSYVCEIMTQAGEILGQKVVEKNTDARTANGTESALTYQGNTTTFSNWESLMNLKNINNPESGVLYFKGTGENAQITLGNIVVPNGAWTLVVDNADLVLGGNITYASTTDLRNIPSIAFIVNDGDILIKNNVRTLSGVFYTKQNVDTYGGAERSAVTDSLLIIGSVYGNIQPLMDKANYVGSPSEDGGGLTIRYDERILLNTPPLLSEYVDIQTHEAIN